MNYSYKHLEHFIVIAKNLSFSKASKILKVAQPALSKQIKELEAALGVDLFIRDKKELKLTNSGHTLVESIATSFQHIHETVDSIKTSNAKLSGELSLGTLMELGQNIIAPLIKSFHKQNPQVMIDLRFRQANELEESLKKGQLDIALLPYPIYNEGIRCYDLFEEDSVLCTSKTNAKNRFDLKQALFITFRDHDPLLLSYLQKFYPKAQIGRLQIALKANSHKVMLDWLKDFPYYCVLPTHAIKDQYEITPVNSSILKNKIYLAFREQANIPKRVMAVQEYLRKHFNHQIPTNN